MSEEGATFHYHIATALTERYSASPTPPAGWREVMVWHLQQAGAYAEAAGAALEVAELHVAELDVVAARQWTERTLELLERLKPVERRAYELRAYMLTLSVLEFGGQYREGLEYARRMLHAAQARHSREAVARALLQVGRMEREVGRLTEAEVSLQQARALAEEDELGDLEADIRIHLAKVHQLQGRHLEALQELRLAQEEQVLRNDDLRLARIFTGIGDVYRVLGASREAMLFYMRALNLEHGQLSPTGQGIMKEKLALALLGQGKLDEARGHAEESLRIRQDMGDVVGQARAFTVLGSILGRLGHHQQAMEFHERARTLGEQTQNQRGQGVALLHLGDEARVLRHYENAQQYYNQALTMAQQSSDQIALARTLERIGDMHLEQGQRDLANKRWGLALKIREALGHADEMRALRERIRTGQLPR